MRGFVLSGLEIESYGEFDIGEAFYPQRQKGDARTPRPGTRAMSSSSRWISAGILALALILRVWALDIKPAHFDEGVNGYFVDQMTRQGFYHYDPTNFHGPLHFYALFVSQTLFGRNLWALRAPLALASTLCVAAALAFRRFMDERVCQIAALFMAVSPGMVFYGRYAIHESWLLLFLMLTAWGTLGLWRDGGPRDLWAAALGVTGMILTKETWVMHVAAFVLAVPCLYYFEKLSPSLPWPQGDANFIGRDMAIAASVCVALIVFFFSGGFLDWSSLPGIWEAFAVWTKTGVEGKTGHEKDWYYWLQLMGRYELPSLIGLGAGFALLAPRMNRAARYLATYGLGALIGYSIVRYKTPWCVISLIWPFYFLLALAVVYAARKVDIATTAVLAGLLGVFSLGSSLHLNFRDFTDENEPYVYVQTLPEINDLLKPLRNLTSLDPENYFLTGHFIGTEQYPFCWILADYPLVDFLPADALPEEPDASFLVVDQTLVDKIEPKLRNRYAKIPLRLRGFSPDSQVLYLDSELFGAYIPLNAGRFTPGEILPEAPKARVPEKADDGAGSR